MGVFYDNMECHVREFEEIIIELIKGSEIKMVIKKELILNKERLIIWEKSVIFADIL